MGRDWIIDVLADLRSFARENDLPLLHQQLEEAGLVAEVEIASLGDDPQHRQNRDCEAPVVGPDKFGQPRQS